MPLAVSVLDADRNPLSHHAFETFLQRGSRYTYSFHCNVGHRALFCYWKLIAMRLAHRVRWYLAFA